jgi:hypothetical protein
LEGASVGAAVARSRDGVAGVSSVQHLSSLAIRGRRNVVSDGARNSQALTTARGISGGPDGIARGNDGRVLGLGSSVTISQLSARVRGHKRRLDDGAGRGRGRRRSLLGNAKRLRWVPWAATELILVAWAVDSRVVVPAELTAAISLGAASIVAQTGGGVAVNLGVGVKADGAGSKGGWVDWAASSVLRVGIAIVHGV